MFKMAENSPRCIEVTPTHPITHPMQGQKKEEKHHQLSVFKMYDAGNIQTIDIDQTSAYRYRQV